MRGRFASVCVCSLLSVACSPERRTVDMPQPGDSSPDAAADSGVVDAGSDASAAAGGGPDGSAADGGGLQAVPALDAGAAAPSNTAGKGGSTDRTPTKEPEQPVDDTIHVTEIATTLLASPSDLDFNPYVSDELWVVNHGDSSATIIAHASTQTRSVLRREDPEGASHFMPQPMGLAFGGRETSIVDAQGKPVEGTFATCPENPAGFMGPTLWASDLRIFGIAKPDREAPFNGPDTGREGPGSHIDMLHRTPACTGIDWEGSGNVYWTYSGTLSMFVRYDFNKDHGIGNDDHSDGSEWRYPVKGISYVMNTPSALAYDREHKRVYMVDTGNARVVGFDPASATMSKPMSGGDNVDGLQTALDMSGGSVSDVVPAAFGLKKPSGLALHESHLYVSDTATSTIHKFDLSGAPLGAALIPDLPAGSLAGLTFGPDGKLYFVDMLGSRVLRLENKF